MSSSKKAFDSSDADQPESRADNAISFDDDEATLAGDVVDALEEEMKQTDAPEASEDVSDNPVIEYQEPAKEALDDVPPEPSADEPVAAKEEVQADHPETEKAIEDIIETEDIEAVTVDDVESEHEPPRRELKPAKPQSEIAVLLKKVWNNRRLRYGIFGGLVVVFAVLAAVPTTRYFLLNTATVRASLELRVIDNSTLQPLRNVTVKAANASAQTDSDGVAKLEGVRLGRTTLRIEKRAYAAQERAVTIGWGSNPLGEYQVVPIGSQYTFYIRDFASGKPIAKAEASSGEGNASSDQDGKLVLALDTATMDDSAQISVQITADAYRSETINITVNNREAQSIEMVPARKHVFVSKRSGNYDVYSVDVDGKNERRIVGGSGYERDDIALIPHPSEGFAAYVATRENTRNQSGYLLSTLYILDVESGDLMRIDQSEQIQVVGWSKSGRLVYVKIAAGASGTDPKRHRLMSFNNEDHSDTKELASSNSFNDVLMANDRVYYAPSNIFQESDPAMYAVDPDGKNSQKLLDKEVFNIIRTDYETILLGAHNEWHEYVLGSPMASLSTAPGSQINRLYRDSPDGSQSVWIDERDGKGVLIRRSQDSADEQVLTERGGLRLPLYWLTNDYLVYRVSDGRETADYLLNLQGGEPRKIIDTTDTSGISRWFYY